MERIAFKLGLHTKINQDTDCWEWQGAKNEKGYGILREGRAHRLAYQAWHGTDPGDKFVCHHCDNPSCINPAHLFLGTNAENMEDAYQKGRMARKLTPDDVRSIRESPLGSVKLGRLYGINPKTIWEIRNYKIWKAV